MISKCHQHYNRLFTGSHVRLFFRFDSLTIKEKSQPTITDHCRSKAETCAFPRSWRKRSDDEQHVNKVSSFPSRVATKKSTPYALVDFKSTSCLSINSESIKHELTRKVRGPMLLKYLTSCQNYSKLVRRKNQSSRAMKMLIVLFCFSTIFVEVRQTRPQLNGLTHTFDQLTRVFVRVDEACFGSFP